MKLKVLEATLLIILFSASFQSAGDPAPAAGSGWEGDDGAALKLSCAANPAEVRRGETVVWNVTLCNSGPNTLNNVFLEVDLDGHIEPVASSPPPSGVGVWRFEEMGAGSCRKIELVARVPEQDRCFVMSRSISGEGFVSLSEEYSTEEEPYEIRCGLSAWIEGMNEPVRNSTVVAVLGEEGAEVRVQEKGSGNYSSIETVRVDLGSKSIEVARNVSARYHGFDLGIGGERSANYTSPWFETVSFRSEPGNFTNLSTRNATVLDRWFCARLDENGTFLLTDQSFRGSFSSTGSGAASASESSAL
jgi:uncharacterized repeat protein (TIGR01451 family)